MNTNIRIHPFVCLWPMECLQRNCIYLQYAGKQEILLTLKNSKPEFEKKYGLKALALFGSYSRGTQVTGTSDVDVMVEFNEPVGIEFIDLADELEALLKLKVDLVSRNGIKPKYFKVIEPELLYV